MTTSTLRGSGRFKYTPQRTASTDPYPIILQRRAAITVRNHLGRGVARVMILIGADLSVLLALRGIGLAIREDALVGAQAASTVGVLFPKTAVPFFELTVSVLLGLAILGTYGSGDHRRDISKILTGSALGLMLVYWHSLWTGPALTTMGSLVASTAIIGAALALERITLDRLRRRLFRPHSPRVLLIGTAENVKEAQRESPFTDRFAFNVIGFIDTGVRPASNALGTIADLVSVIDQYPVDSVIICGNLPDELLRDVVGIADAGGCQIYSRPNTLIRQDIDPHVTWINGTPLLRLTSPGIRGQQLVAKRVLDIGLAGFGLVALSPLFLAVAILVWATSRGPILFRQRRIGIGGRPFSIIKFRTMITDAEARLEALGAQSIYSDQRLFKIPNDPRVTRVGGFLRRLSLDELPQLWNVIRGDMSIVGPRPPLPSEVALYEEHHYTRFDMRPGITGPWQVSGRNNIRDFEEVIRLETAYMREWNILRDFAILARTVPVVLKMDGAH